MSERKGRNCGTSARLERYTEEVKKERSRGGRGTRERWRGEDKVEMNELLVAAG